MMKNIKMGLMVISCVIIGGIIGINAAELITSNQVIYKDNQTVDVALNSLFDELQEGKELLAESISNQGVETTSENTLAEMAYNVSNISNSSEILLWTNTDSTSTFSSQTVNLDLSEYRAIKIYSMRYTTTQVLSTSECEIGQRCILEATPFGYSDTLHGSRTYSVSNSAVTFDTAFGYQWSGTGSENNAFCIPYKIFGIK